MRWLSPIALFCCVALVGCRSNNSDRAYLYQELREQEDEIYALEDMLDQYEAKLASSRRANESLRRELAGGDGDDDPTRSSIPQTFQPPRIDFEPPSTPDSDAPRYEPTEPLPAPSTLPLDAPELEMPDPSEDDSIRQSAYYELYPSDDSSSAAGSLLKFQQQKEEEITDYRVDRITLNRQLTGAHNRDKLPGDEGVYIVVEPKNKADQVIDVPGKLTIVVMDPQKRGPEGRIARWDYSAEEAANSFRQSIFGRGMHLELPWPGEAPQAEELNLYVRFITDDGRRLIAEKSIHPDPLPTTEYVDGSPPPCDDCLSEDHSGDETTELAGESHDSWRRRTRSFRSLIPATTSQARTASLDALSEPEPAIGIPTTASTANFDAPVEVDLGPSREAPQSARLLQTSGEQAANDAEFDREEVPYEFGPQRPDITAVEPEPREVIEEPAPPKQARRRVEWSPYR